MSTHSWSRKARTPAMIAEDTAARISRLPTVASQPNTVARPSRSRIPRENADSATAGGMLPNGIGRNRMIARSRQAAPTIRSGTGWSSMLIRGRRMRSARCRMGLSFAVSRAKKSREMFRSQMKRGIHRVGRPSISWAVMKRSGAPRTADVPGGSGSMLGAANRSIRAPKARSPKAFSTSPRRIAASGRLARSFRTSENRRRGSASASRETTGARLLDGSGMVRSR
jgi:hypothetical protein